MTINYLAVFVCGMLSMVVGSIWYGPLFGRKWCQIVGANPDDVKARKEMQKKAGPLYAVQFLLTLFQVTVLARLIADTVNVSGLERSLWIFAAFVMPTIAGSSMWNNESTKKSWDRFFVQTGYQLVMFGIYGVVLGMWK